MPRQKQKRRDRKQEQHEAPTHLESPVFTGNPTTDAPPPETALKLTKVFSKILLLIEHRLDSDVADNDELKHIIEMIEQETTKGDSANPGKIRDWLQTIAEIDPNVFDAFSAAIVNRLPLNGMEAMFVYVTQTVRKENR